MKTKTLKVLSYILLVLSALLIAVSVAGLLIPGLSNSVLSRIATFVGYHAGWLYIMFATNVLKEIKNDEKRS